MIPSTSAVIGCLATTAISDMVAIAAQISATRQPGTRVPAALLDVRGSARPVRRAEDPCLRPGQNRAQRRPIGREQRADLPQRRPP
jgi:hypothetical protein